MLPLAYHCLGRGADAFGVVPFTPTWGAGSTDPRLAYPGSSALARSLSALLQLYGAWWTGLEANDRVAILARRGSFRPDVAIWKLGLHTCGPHFAQVLGAYTCCLYAGFPARILFEDDLLRLPVGAPTALDDIDLLLLVDEQEPITGQLAALLDQATQRSGTAGPLQIRRDAASADTLPYPPLTLPGSQQPPYFTGFIQLNADDDQYRTLRKQVIATAAALVPALRPLTPRWSRPDIERMAPRAGSAEEAGPVIHARSCLQGRYLLVVDDAPVPLSPAQLWRMTTRAASRLPLLAKLDPHLAPGEVVYDVFRGGPPVATGPVQLDLRHNAGALFAVLPAAIEHILLNGPATVTGGDVLHVIVEVRSAGWRRIAASVPVQVSLEEGTAELDQQVVDVRGDPAAASFRVPLTGSPTTLRVRATDLIAGHEAELTVAVQPAPAPVDLAVPPTPNVPPITARSDRLLPAGPPWTRQRPAGRLFGPHAREAVTICNGDIVVIATADWGEHLFALNTADGSQLWTGAAGQHLPFNLIGLDQGVAVTGFSFTTQAPGQGNAVFDAEGYRLLVFQPDGASSVAITGYGLPSRAPHRFLPEMLMDPPAMFAVSRDGNTVVSSGNLGVAVWTRATVGSWALVWHRDHLAANPLARDICAVALTPTGVVIAEPGYLIALGLQHHAPELWRLEFPNWDFGARTILTADPVPAGKPERLAVVSDQFGGTTTLVTIQPSTPGQPRPVPQITAVLVHPVDHAALSGTGALIAITAGTELLLYDQAGHLLWSLPGDDILGPPKFSTDSARIAVASHLGTLYVADAQDGTLLRVNESMNAATFTWLPRHELIVATWSGDVRRLTASPHPGSPFYSPPNWAIRLNPTQNPQDLMDSFNNGDAPALRVPITTVGDAPDPTRPNPGPDLLAGRCGIVTLSPPLSVDMGYTHGILPASHDAYLAGATEDTVSPPVWLAFACWSGPSARLLITRQRVRLGASERRAPEVHPGRISGPTRPLCFRITASGRGLFERLT